MGAGTGHAGPIVGGVAKPPAESAPSVEDVNIRGIMHRIP
jgi:hypothetical protein